MGPAVPWMHCQWMGMSNWWNTPRTQTDWWASYDPAHQISMEIHIRSMENLQQPLASKCWPIKPPKLLPSGNYSLQTMTHAPSRSAGGPLPITHRGGPQTTGPKTTKLLDPTWPQLFHPTTKSGQDTSNPPYPRYSLFFGSKTQLPHDHQPP